MITIKDVVLLNKNAPDTAISFSFDKGKATTILYSEKYKFDFLCLKDQSLDEGTFSINNVRVFPEENNGYSIFFIAINSLVKVGLCFLLKTDEKQDKVKDIVNELSSLREMPSQSEIEQKGKISAIFCKIRDLMPAYMVIDLNEKVNISNHFLMSEINGVSSAIPTVLLEVKAVPENVIEIGEINDVQDLTINSADTTSNQQSSNDESFLIFAPFKKNIFVNMFETLKKNAMVFFSFLIPTIGVIAFLLLSPLYLKTNNKLLIIPFIITISICFVLYMLMTYRCTLFTLDKKETDLKQKRIIFYVINTIVTLIGIGLGIVIYILFKNYDSELKQLPFNKSGLILAVIFSVIMITACLYLAPVFQLIKNLVLKLFRKSNKK